jgi:hypothetical protein
MTEVMNPPRPAPGPASATPLRTREPRGMIGPAESTDRLAGLIGKHLTHVSTSLERIVLSIAADPVHLVVISGPVQLSGPQGSGLRLEGGQAAALLAGWVGRPVTALRVDEGGGLHVVVGAYQLAVAAEDVHEAWEIRGMDGGLMVCLPGGRISVWAPTFGRIPRTRPAGW